MKWTDLLKQLTIKSGAYRNIRNIANEAYKQNARVKQVHCHPFFGLLQGKVYVNTYRFIYNHFLSKADINFLIIGTPSVVRILSGFFSFVDLELMVVDRYWRSPKIAAKYILQSSSLQQS